MSYQREVRRPSNFKEILAEAKKLLAVVQKYNRDAKNDSEEHVWEREYEPKWQEAFKQLAKLILESKTVANLVSRDDLRERLQNVWLYEEKKPFFEFSDKDLENYLDYFFGRSDTYHFFFPLQLTGLPDGYSVGLSVVHEFNVLPEQLKTHLSQEWDYSLEGEKMSYGAETKEEYLEAKKRETYFCFDVEALGVFKAGEIATRIANQSLNIIKTTYDFDLRKLARCYWTKGKGYGSVEPRSSYDPFGWFRHPNIPELERYATTMTDMIRKADNSEIAKKCLSAVDIYGLIERETPVEVRFLLSVISLEAILLGKNDKELIGMKLREKVAILVGDTPAWFAEHLGKEDPTREECEANRVAARIDLSKQVYDMYDKRSKFAHADNEREKVTESDYRFATMIFRLSLQRVVSLYEKGIRRVAKADTVDKESLDFLIEFQKYSTPLGWP